MKVITRKQAKKLGLIRYYTGSKCKNGHTDERRTRNGECISCNRERSAANTEKYKEWCAQNRDKLTAIQDRYKKKNRHKVRARCKSWRERNLHKGRQYKAARTARILKATPSWADKEAIKFFYECCPKGFHVDHIVPLRGRNVCGLHVETNLQWLPAHDNHVKSNKWAA